MRGGGVHEEPRQGGALLLSSRGMLTQTRIAGLLCADPNPHCRIALFRLLQDEGLGQGAE